MRLLTGWRSLQSCNKISKGDVTGMQPKHEAGVDHWMAGPAGTAVIVTGVHVWDQPVRVPLRGNQSSQSSGAAQRDNQPP